VTSIASTYHQAAQRIASHPQSERLRKLLFALHYHQWPSHAPEMNTAQLEEMLGAIVQHSQTPKGLATQLTGIVSTLNKAQVYQKVAAALLQIVAPLYPQASSVAVAKPALSMAELYNLRLELTRYCTPLQVKLLLAALLTHKPVHAQGLERFTLIDLLQRVVGRFSDSEALRARVQQALQQFNNDGVYANVGDRLLKLLQRFPSDAAVEVTMETTPPTVDPAAGDDDDELTCQLFA